MKLPVPDGYNAPVYYEGALIGNLHLVAGNQLDPDQVVAFVVIKNDDGSCHLSSSMVQLVPATSLDLRSLEERAAHPGPRTFCPACGPNVDVDEDGCCASCGGDAVGEWADRVCTLLSVLSTMLALFKAKG